MHFATAVKGLNTEKSSIDQLAASNSKFSYTGSAFDGKDKGTLSYNVDFGSRKGSGEITGLKTPGKVTLHEGNIAQLNEEFVKGYGIRGEASAENFKNKFTGHPDEMHHYELGFFGPEANEVAGVVHFFDKNDDALGNGQITFGGSRHH